MPRTVVSLVTGESYHVYNRGVDKREIFQSKADYLRFYQSLDVFNSVDPCSNFRDALSQSRLPDERLVQFSAYALLPNHFHFVLTQLVDGGISEFMKRVQGGYTSYFNERTERSGALFQGTFKRIHIDSDEYLRYLIVYVNENHFVHKVPRGEDIYYSSSRHFQGTASSKLLAQTNQAYDFDESKLLAADIASRREFMKAEL